jgi:hypothetical protein
MDDLCDLTGEQRHTPECSPYHTLIHHLPAAANNAARSNSGSPTMTIPSAASLKIIIAAITVAMLAAGVAEAPSKSSMHQIAIAYEKPKNPAHDRLHDLLVEARVLEQVQRC